ncbi:MAG: septum formation initiator family protein [Deltaproteobacteria bacterium]|nr:septum formation initiator family protein [Deltaproteobacteria bacterium]
MSGARDRSGPGRALRRVMLGAGALVLLLLGLTVFGDRGLLHLGRLRQEHARLLADNQRIRQQNDALRQEVLNLRGNKRYVEEIARRELGLVREGEIVYHFRK